MLPFQQVFDKVYDAHLSGKTAFFNVRIGDYMCKLLLAPGASPQTPPGGLFLPPGPPPPAWVDASHGHGLGHQINSIQLLVPEPSLRPSSGSRGRLWNGLHDVMDLACTAARNAYRFVHARRYKRLFSIPVNQSAETLDRLSVKGV